MTLEGVSSPGNILQNHQLAEAGNLASLDAKLEKDTAIKKTHENSESQTSDNNPDKEGQNPASGYYSEEDKETAEKISTEKPIRFAFKFNNITEKVELIELSSSKIVENINPKDFIKLVKQLKYNSGMFIDNQA